MSEIQQTIHSFNAGVLTPLLLGRSDHEKYRAGALRMLNCFAKPQGPTEQRPGTEFIFPAKTDSAQIALLPFIFSSTDNCTLEFGFNYIRMFSGDGVLLSGEAPYEVATTYLSSELCDLRTEQSLDVLYIVHGKHRPMQLERHDTTDWQLSEFNFKNGPFETQNSDVESTVTPSAKSGTNKTLTATSAIFSDDMVDSLFRVRHIKEENAYSGEFDSVESSDEFAVSGPWEFVTHGNWDGTMVIERKVLDDPTWMPYRTFTSYMPASDSSGDNNVRQAGDEQEDGVIYRISMTARDYGTCSWDFSVQDDTSCGVAKIKTVATDGKSCTCDIIEAFGATTASSRWSEGSWSEKLGYPTEIFFHDERLCFLNGLKIWMSRAGDYSEMEAGTKDDDAIDRFVSSARGDSMLWAVPQKSVVVGTSGSVLQLGTGSDNKPTSASNLRNWQDLTDGCANIRGIKVNDVVLYVQLGGRRVLESSFSLERDSLVAADMTRMADHITKSGIKSIAFQRTPEPTLWCVLNNGKIAVMTYARSENVIAWSELETDGKVLEVCVLPSGGEEERVWIAVQRTIGGVDKVYIERFALHAWEEIEDCFFVDSGLTREYESDVSQVSGLEHLEGKSVQVLGDGQLQAEKTVASGIIAIDPPAKKITVGLGYRALTEPMPLEIVVQQGTSLGTVKRVVSARIQFYRSLGVSAGVDEDSLEGIVDLEFSHAMGEPIPPFSGVKELTLSGDWDKSGKLVIVQDNPLPMTVLSIAPKLAIGV